MWAWLKYWFLDSADVVTLMLIDKGYYDYDYTEPKTKADRNISKATDPEKLKAKLARLGIGAQTIPQTTAERLQAKVRDEERKRAALG